MANVWINEVHYDNAGTDSGEFIEIAARAGTDLTGWSIVLYNGNTPGAATTYGTSLLSGVVADQTGTGFGFFVINFPSNGLQNGTNDGFALVDASGTVVEFLSYEGVVTASNGPAAGLTSTDIGVAEAGTEALGLSLQRTGSGDDSTDFASWTAPQTATSGAANAGQTFQGSPAGPTVSIAALDAAKSEGNGGVTTYTFEITRTGSTDVALTLTYAVTGSGPSPAIAADFEGAAFPAGTVTIPAGASRVALSIPVSADTVQEGTETFTVTLSGPPAGVTIAQGAAQGMIINDDVTLTRIFDIQGDGHTSDLAGQSVTTEGIVTGILRKATGERGFYIQDPNGDGNGDTSDAIFVFTGGAFANVQVGDVVRVSGTVSEFVRSGTTGNLSLTQISGSPTVSVIGNVGIDAATGLPVGIAPVRVGDGMGTTGERAIPAGEFGDNPATGEFNTARDAIDFWESMEGMAVTIEQFRATSPTSGFVESWGVANGATNPSATPSGSVVASEIEPFRSHTPGEDGRFDLNPERIQLDNDLDNNKDNVLDFTWSTNVGADFGDVTGIVHYDRGAYEVEVSKAPTITGGVSEKEVTTIEAHKDFLRIASFNVENLAPADGTPDPANNDKLDKLVAAIKDNLKLPDIIGLQEIQDGSGATNDGQTSARDTLRELIQAIYQQTGVVYEAIDAPPTYRDGQQILFSTLDTLPENERYSYVFEGNAQVLDQILLSGAAMNRAKLDVVHMNAEFADQISDHDPSVVQIYTPRWSLVSTDGSDRIDARAYAAIGSDLSGDDIIEALGGDDVVKAGSGNDEVLGGDGDDQLFGDDGDDMLSGDSGNDDLRGGSGNDLLAGGTGNDALYGNDGNDTLLGGDGADLLSGDKGDDSLSGGAGNDDIRGGDGLNLLFGGDGDDAILGGKDADTTHGGAGADDIHGGKGNDTLDGGDGDDIVVGGAGDDLLAGGAGIDILWGDAGNDILIGGDDRDYFSFASQWGDDRIQDFEDGLDIIDLSGVGGLSRFNQLTLVEVDGGLEVLFGANSIFLAAIVSSDMSQQDFMI